MTLKEKLKALWDEDMKFFTEMEELKMKYHIDARI